MTNGDFFPSQCSDTVLQLTFQHVPPKLFAAIDLGSNSFRLEIARLDHGLFQRSDYFKETVRQGNGLDAEERLSPAAMQRGWDCLARFGERLQGFDASTVRAVATQTLREARNRDEFLFKAEGMLGFPIDVIAGREEARLIYLGVTHALPFSEERRLVVNIGGRSTEIIIGRGLKSQKVESYQVGSLAWSLRYFPDGQFTTAAFKAAEIAAKAVLDEGLENLETGHWDTAYGSSGTVGAVADALVASGWPAGGITLADGALRHGVLHELLDLPRVTKAWKEGRSRWRVC